MATSNIDPGGLHLLNADEVTSEELEQFRAYYDNTKGSQNKSYEFWVEFRPDVLKRHKARTRQWYLGGTFPVQALACLHQYVISGFGDGIGYEVRLAQTEGAKLTDILDTLSIAFIHSGHRGMYRASEMASYLRTYEEKGSGWAFPPNWGFDPDAFVSGMDFSTLEATAEDLGHLRHWYETTTGEVPRHVDFLAQYRPDLLKAYRNRYEHAIRDSLPKQMLPYLMLHYNVYRGSRSGIRENVLLGRAFGLTRTQVLNAICSSVLHAGANALDVIEGACGDLLPTFPDS
jgi:hypothetical protein